MRYFRLLNSKTSHTFCLIGILTLTFGCTSQAIKDTDPIITPATNSPATSPNVQSSPTPLTPEAKALAQRLAQYDALDLLQKGEEAEALKTLEKSLTLDPNNELAKRLIYQIGSDAQLELGKESFPYKVQPNDTLGKLAQRFLNDQYRFYILAKYNGMRVPNKLEVGQIIRIPGIPPKNLYPVKAAEPLAKPSETPKVIEPEKTVVLPPTPPVTTAPKEVDQAQQQKLIKQLSRDAESAYRRQQLNLAIQKWNEVLAISPDNQQAKQKRDHAQQLKDKIDKFKGVLAK